MKNTNNNLSFPRFVVGNLPLSKSLLKEEKQSHFNKKAEDPRQKLSGMTPNFTGFTLIELLVVVLIIGILAAVALPQYQKAVEKSKATQALTLLKTVGQAALTYQLANGEYPSSFDELAVEIPWTGTQRWYNRQLDTRSNEDWSLQLYKTDDEGALLLYAGRLSGKYKGGGFVFVVSPGNGNTYKDEAEKISCAERVSAGVLYEGEAGSYCKLFGATQRTAFGSTFRSYKMP